MFHEWTGVLSSAWKTFMLNLEVGAIEDDCAAFPAVVIPSVGPCGDVTLLVYGAGEREAVAETARVQRPSGARRASC